MERDKATNGRRQYTRYPLSQTVTFEVSAPLTLQESRQQEQEAEGNTRNVSEGGLCLITQRALEESQIIKIKIPIPNVVATTPTLAEVRWVRSGQQAAVERHSDHYLVGLRFLF